MLNKMVAKIKTIDFLLYLTYDKQINSLRKAYLN